MIFDTMFSRYPFDCFGNEVEDYNPWTNWGYRTPPRQQYRHPEQFLRRSTRRGRRQPWTAPFLANPDEEEIEEKPLQKHYYPAQQKACKKCRQAERACPQSSSRNDVTIPVTVINDKEVDSNGTKTKQGVQGKRDYLPSDHPSSQTEQRNAQELKTEKQESAAPATQQTISNMKEDLNENKTKETDIRSTCDAAPDKPESSHCEEIIFETTQDLEEKPLATENRIDEGMEEGEDNIDEKQPSDATEENTENREPEDIEKKLEFINQQLRKARELTPKEVLLSPRTDKEKLYLTEMLLRCILDLDSIETRGNETVKQTRRNAVREIQSYLDIVENQ